jgi:hypothetical protein
MAYVRRFLTETVLARNAKNPKKNQRIKEWPGPGSNRRHTDFQSVALPSELPGLLKSTALLRAVKIVMLLTLLRTVNAWLLTSPYQAENPANFRENLEQSLLLTLQSSPQV